MERINDHFKQSPLIELLGHAAKFTVVVAIVSGAWTGIKWQLEADNRAKERHYRAWDLINAARGSTGDGGRRDALQDLNKDGVSLASAPLEKAYLPRVDLKGADLQGADLQGADLRSANLQGANLFGANLQSANLFGANLQGANLNGANLQDAILAMANLKGARMWDANLREAALGGANLQDAHLNGANLQGAHLIGANLQGANLNGANLQGAHNLTQEQLDVANGDDWTKLPEGFTRPAHWKPLPPPPYKPPYK